VVREFVPLHFIHLTIRTVEQSVLTVLMRFINIYQQHLCNQTKDFVVTDRICIDGNFGDCSRYVNKFSSSPK